jgi:gliding motility-associated-like protein
VIGYTVDPLFYDIPGSYTVHWVFTDDHENTTSIDQIITVRNSEDSIPGYGYVDCNLDNDSSLNINLNNFLPEGTNENGIWTSSSNTQNLNGSIFSPYLAPTGNYDFQYLYQEDNCPQTASVTIEVNNDCFVAPACNLMVHNSFSPNNDGINETFFIENIDQISCFPTNSVEIYNRWGVLVYKTKQYDNLTRVFRGVSEGRATINESDQLPTGTYFYTIKYTDAKGKEYEDTGYLYLVL